ncbi:hypothetical protein CAEBREN_30379 [Caenorhabditis brenneri]|uniref:Uncharacterized protein n=1 Tax=Caenorhabditis brenneri TaxID=135651 RepID=G0PA50_CAEBE|nr:hypothetical protein CAEBREN_30379 [Caenorhabditis brenneri]
MSEELETLFKQNDMAQQRMRIGELQGQVKAYEFVVQDLKAKYEREQEENKALRLTLALRTDCESELRRSSGEKSPGVEDLEIKLVIAEKEIMVMESTNKELLATLNNTRAQLGKILRERNQKVKEIEQLEEALENMETRHNRRPEELNREFESTSYAANIQLLVDELRDQSSRWAAEKVILTKRFEETEDDLRKENEKLKKQKEDIVNHSNNSEKMWTERLKEISADLDRLQTRQLAKSVKSEKACIAETEAEIQELNRKLKDAVEAIEELELANTGLQKQLDKANIKLVKLEIELESQQFLVKEQNVSSAESADYKLQIDRLLQEKTKLDELCESQQRDLVEITEKHTQQTITFSNEKAKFCHDMERVEERWNNEVVKMREHHDVMERMLSAATKDAMDEKKLFEEESCELREKVEELQCLLKDQQRQLETNNQETQQLRDQLKEARAVQATSNKEWDDECAGLEDEIYELMDKRKTEAKKMRTMSRKNMWLTKSIRNLSEQRREELESKKSEIEALTALRNHDEKEREELMIELESERKNCKEEISTRVKMNNQIVDLQKKNEELQEENEELHKLNEALEEKVESVTDQWRSECEIYENNITFVTQKHEMEREDAIKKIQNAKKIEEKLYANMNHLVKENQEFEKMLKTQRREATELHKATVELSKMEMDNLRMLLDMER